MQKLPLKKLIISSEFALIIALLAQITIPFGLIPLTGQTFAIGLVATILGARLSTLATLIYILLGLIGLPVFAGFSSGLGVIFGSTGGFLLGFLVTTCLTGKILEKFGFTYTIAFIANCLGALIDLMIGSCWLKFSAHLLWQQAFHTGLILFLLPGFIKAIAAAWCGIFIRKRLMKLHFFATLF